MILASSSPHLTDTYFLVFAAVLFTIGALKKASMFSPGTVQITGGVRSKADWFGGNATLNFWRAAENRYGRRDSAASAARSAR